MKGIYTPVTKIRRQVFQEIARLAFEGEDYSQIEELPYKIIPGEVASYRDSVFKERAIVGERLRLACGLDVRPADKHAPVSEGIEAAGIDRLVYEPPLINVIPFACEACPTKQYQVTDNCRGCLAHPCVSVCPVKAVSMVDGHSHIDKDKCLKCGRCAESCPYNAIVKYERPCAASCGVDAIESDYLGRAKINHDKCVACGQCLVHCPFAAIADKSQIFQLCHALRENENIIAEIAPSFVGQFGPLATPERVRKALLTIGFTDVYEVAVGADLGAVAEAHHYVNGLSDEQPFLATSCCPSWSVMAKTLFPTIANCVSTELTPMVATARIIKKEHPDARVVFIGPCTSKKLEALRRTVRSDVDFVITYEELMGMFAAKEIEFGAYEDGQMRDEATAGGRGYGVAGGVASAIEACVKELYPGHEVKIDRAEGLSDCRKMLTLAKAGKRKGYILEGMACPGGCIGGAGTLEPLKKAAAAVNKFAQDSKQPLPTESAYIGELGDNHAHE